VVVKDVDEGEDEEEDKIEGTMDEKVFRDTRSDERNASMVVYSAQIYTMICNIFLPNMKVKRQKCMRVLHLYTAYRTLLSLYTEQHECCRQDSFHNWRR